MQQFHTLTLAGIPLPREIETLHWFFAGTTGAGKTTAIAEMLDGTRARGDRCIICDPNGGYLTHFAQDGDRLLNPFGTDEHHDRPDEACLVLDALFVKNSFVDECNDTNAELYQRSQQSHCVEQVCARQTVKVFNQQERAALDYAGLYGPDERGERSFGGVRTVERRDTEVFE